MTLHLFSLLLAFAAPPPGCINSAPTIATMSPCAGPPGTTIKIAPGSKMKKPASELVFRPIFPVLAPLQVRVTALTPSGPNYTLAAPKALCSYGAKWNVFLLSGAGAGTLTQIGAFAID